MLVTVVCLGLWGCGEASVPGKGTSTPESNAASQAADEDDLVPILSIRELMTYIVDPVSDLVFDAVSVDITADGVAETVPQSSENWFRDRNSTVTQAPSADQ